MFIDSQGGHGARFFTNGAGSQSPWLPVSHSFDHTRTLLSYIFPRVLIHECDAVIKIIQGEFILGEWFHIDDLVMFQHRI